MTKKTKKTDNETSEEQSQAAEETEAPATETDNTNGEIKDSETDVEEGVQEESDREEAEETSEVEELREELDELREEYDELHEKYLRLGAEFDNYKKRTDREFTRQVQFANEELFREVLPILDDLERTINATKEESSFEQLKEGVGLVYNNFKNILKRRGVEPIESVGEEFDPELHEAMMVQESEEHESETVIQEFERGYKLGDTVLRHAKVVVSK